MAMSSLNPEQTSWEELHISKYKSPDEVKFLKAANVYSKTRLPTATEADGEERDNSSKFEESWAGSERPSTISIPESDLHLHTHSPGRDVSTAHHRSALQTLLSENSRLMFKGENSRLDDLAGDSQRARSSGSRADRNIVDSESVLSKYVDRFRHGLPMSREERADKVGTKPGEFWWLPSSPLTPSDSSTPKDSSGVARTRARTKDAQDPHRPPATALTRANVEGRSKMSESAVEAMTRYIQDKADKLLEKTTSTLSSEPAVSTDGLGTMCSSTAPPSSALDDEEAYRPAFTRLHKGKENIPAAAPNPWGSGGDILAQWRRQRKIEVATEKVLHGSGNTVLPSSAERISAPAPQDADVESKLAEFRQRLGHRTGGSPLKTSSHLHFTPAPPRESSQQPRDACLSTNDQPDSERAHPTISGLPLHAHSPIASPHHLPQRHLGLRTTDPPEPHLHMSCDILPCPLVGEKPADPERRHLDFDERTCVSDSDSSFERLKRKHMKNLEKEYRGRRRATATDGRRNRDDADNDDNDTAKKRTDDDGQHDCQLVPERDTTSRKPRSKKIDTDSAGTKRSGVDKLSNSTSGNPEKASTSRPTEKDLTTERAQRRKESEKDKRSRKQEGGCTGADFETQRKTESRIRRNAEDGGGGGGEGGRGGGRKDYTTFPSDTSTTDLTEVSECDDDNTYFGANAGGERRNHQAPEHGQAVPGVIGDRENRETVSRKKREDQDVGKRRKSATKENHGVPPPKCQSSPKEGLQSAVGQVVQERLFTSMPLTSMSLTLTSSIDSTRNDQSSPQGEAPASLEEAILSDGEEFPGDDILQNLREKRSSFLTQLKEIDDLLAEMDS